MGEAKEYWISFFREAGLPDQAEIYASRFVDNRMHSSVLCDLNESHFIKMGITAVGDILIIQRHIKLSQKKSEETMVVPDASINKLNDSGSSVGKPKKKKSKIEEFNDAVIECKGNYGLLASRASSIITDQEKDNTKYEAVLRIIALRSKLESFVQKNYPKGINKKTDCTIYGKPETLSYCDALNEIILSNDVRFTADEFIVMIRKRLDEFGIEPKIFIRFARWLYSEFSDSACHKMVQFAPPLPDYKDTEAIKNILSYVQIDVDVPAIQCIQLILKPLEMPTGNVVP